MPQLQYVKVDVLQTHSALVADPARPMLDTRHVLNVLDPELHAQVARQHPAAPSPARAPAPQPAAEPAAYPASASPAPGPQPRVVVKPPASEEARIGLAQVRVREQAIEVLTPLLGNGVLKKVDAIASRHSPVHQPSEFLRECESLASMIVGKTRAGELFAPLHLQVRG